jgi:hypothetical protein
VAVKTYTPNFDGFITNYYNYDCGPDWYVIKEYPWGGFINSVLNVYGPYGVDGTGLGDANNQRGFVEFNLSSNPIPAGATINDITLNLNIYSNSETRDCYIKELTQSPLSYDYDGRVLTYTIDPIGENYQVGDIIYLNPFNICTIRVLGVNGSGGITSSEIVNGGHSYGGIMYATGGSVTGSGAGVTPTTTSHGTYSTLYDEINTSDVYITIDKSELTGVNSYSLGSNAIIEFNLHPTWFATGLLMDESTWTTNHSMYFHSRAYTPYPPTLEVTYTAGTTYRRRIICS